MKELMENGPVQGRELGGALPCRSGICALGCTELRGDWGGTEAAGTAQELPQPRCLMLNAAPGSCPLAPVAH